jgi:hypothetical protein
MTDKKKHTAMQQLIDHINDRLIASKELGRDTDYIENILENAINLLNVEKQQIIKAYNDGMNYWSMQTAEEHYNTTFNTKKQMKTPMQKLTSELHKIGEEHVDDSPEDYEYKAGLQTAAIIAENMINEEKEVIQNAFYEGMLCQPFDPNMGRAEMYYNTTFNTNEK